MPIPKVSLLIDTDRESDRDFLKGITRYCIENNPWEFVFKPLKYLHTATSSHEWGIHKNSDGFITRGFESLSKIKRFNKPVIASGIKRETNTKVATVITNSKAIGEMGAKHLMGLGMDNFAYCGFSKIEWSKKRETSFTAELKNFNFKNHSYNLYSGTSTSENRNKLSRWLKSLPKPIGIMACNDDCAMQIMEIAKALKIQIPQQISVLGVDNDELICNLTNPPISSIYINFEKSGYESATLLNEMMLKKKQLVTQITVEPIEIIERQSTNILLIQNDSIANALRYIQSNFKSAIQVEDVASHVGLSRRALEKQFKKNINRTIYSEIRDQRINHIAKLLMETNMTVSEIMSTLDYSSPEHIARQFRSTKGVSPIAYRKQRR